MCYCSWHPAVYWTWLYRNGKISKPRVFVVDSDIHILFLRRTSLTFPSFFSLLFGSHLIQAMFDVFATGLILLRLVLARTEGFVSIAVVTGKYQAMLTWMHYLTEECGSTVGERRSYNLHWHIISIFIVFAASAAGILIPICTKLIPPLAISPQIITYGAYWLQLYHLLHTYPKSSGIITGKSFGTGVIVATAFIHMLQPAFEKLASPCLGSIWNERYPSFAALFTMIAILSMHLVEYFAHEYMQRKFDRLQQDTKSHEHSNAFHEQSNVYIKGQRTDQELIPVLEESSPAETVSKEEMSESRRWLSTLTLELGILAHSIIIGITLGVSDQGGFVGLLIALCVHQFFEGIKGLHDPKWQDQVKYLLLYVVVGFALGARIAEVNRIRLQQAVIMSLFFSITAPVGNAIGAAISQFYDMHSKAALLAQGIFESISSGILIYVGLINLLASEMLCDENFRRMRHSTKAANFIALYTGAAVMAIVAIWI